MRVWKFVYFLLVPLAWAQTALKVVPEGAVAGNLGLASITATSNSTEPSALQWTITYPSTVFGDGTITAGPALKAAGKSLSCVNRTGQMECLAWGDNTTGIASGVVATWTVALSPTAPSTSTLGLTSVAAVSGQGVQLSGSGQGATVTITPASAGDKIASLKCNETAIVTPGAATCTVTLGGIATVPTKVILALGTGSAKVTIGSGVIVNVGSQNATFAINATKVSVTEKAIVVASANDSLATVNLTLEP